MTGLAMAVGRFYWMIQDLLAGCSRPGGPAGGSASVDDDLHWLACQGIQAVLSLTEAPLAQQALDRHGLTGLHLPVADLTAPTPQQFLDALTFIDCQHALDRGVVVHCRMGQGRTGTVLAAHLVRRGMDPQAALDELRAICPGAISSPAQERALQAFAARRDWVL
jgi:atypical dual specificity phosphatase